ncbi:heavy-metal-associated domain-containing protein [Psychrobacter sp. 1U2]|uniref:heavy-metal-associated domain-containing protein n=1 Tax=Psychrobacter sp. 1U2 TaxID=3453577 RepID=UPI003F45ADCB
MANQTRIIKVDGMTCEKCVESVHGATVGMDGVVSIAVDLADNLATVTFDDAKTSADKIASAIDNAGFDATVANS